MKASTFLVLCAMTPNLPVVAIGLLVAGLSYLAINDLFAGTVAR